MKLLVLLLVSTLFVVACNEGGGAKKAELKTEEDKTFYAMGFMLGANLQRLNLKDQELAALYTGIVDSAKGAEAAVEMPAYQPKIQEMFKKRMEMASQNQKSGGEKFINDYMAKNKDAKKTQSGLVYHILKEGSGAMPKAEDSVEVHYHGQLIDGTVFDSSVDRGKTITFPLNRVIKGWTEGLQLVKEGGKVRLIIPADLAYGDAGAPPKIPGGATLQFEVELFKINPTDDKKDPSKK